MHTFFLLADITFHIYSALINEAAGRAHSVGLPFLLLPFLTKTSSFMWDLRFLTGVKTVFSWRKKQFIPNSQPYNSAELQHVLYTYLPEDTRCEDSSSCMWVNTVWRFCFHEMQLCAVWYTGSNVSEVPAASIFRIKDLKVEAAIYCKERQNFVTLLLQICGWVKRNSKFDNIIIWGTRHKQCAQYFNQSQTVCTVT
jgi:hypothetical protein